MKRHVFYILSGMFLVLGLSIIPNRELSELQAGTGVPVSNASQYSESVCTLSSISSDKGFMEDCHSLFDDGMSGYKVYDGIISGFLSPRNIAPPKVLKFNNATFAILILSSINIRLPEIKYRNLPTHVLYMKYLCGYYVYTLARILI